MAAALADFLGDLFLGVVEAIDQLVIGGRFLDRIEILALHVFDDGEFEGFRILHLADDHRHVMQLGALRRAPAPLARHDLETVAHALDGAHENRLKDSLFADGVREIFQFGFGEILARLVRIRFEKRDRQSCAWFSLPRAQASRHRR